EYDEIRERWAKYYVELRPREDSYNDETGWTIFTDYQPEKHGGLSYADEAFTILSVIHYCLSEERAQTHWTRAANLLDDFRATIFASGRWEDRLTFCEQVIEHARADRQLPTLGKFYRLLAWILCFRDQYDEGRARAKDAIQVASEGLRMEGLSEQDR